MEHLLLKVLAFDLAVPTTNQFLLQYLRRQGVCVRTENLAKVCLRPPCIPGTQGGGEEPFTTTPSSSSFLVLCLGPRRLVSRGRKLINLKNTTVDRVW